jgi:hypothetical protein
MPVELTKCGSSELTESHPQSSLLNKMKFALNVTVRKASEGV